MSIRTLVVVVMVWGTGCASPAPVPPPPPDTRFDQLADAVRRDVALNPATAASVAVWLDGEVIWVGGFGQADPDGTLAPGEDTQFMIGSDTKKIAALSLLRKVAAGRVALDRTVGSLLPQLHMAKAPGFEAATLRQLLSHQGGIADGVELTTTTTDASLASYAYGAFAAGYDALAAPGRFWNYSNPNFSIAGLIDQQLDGRPWADIVEQDIFAPLGMTRTVARKAEVDDDYAPGHGFTVDDDTAIRRVGLDQIWEAGFTRPAGLVWSTPGDQMRLAAFLVDGDPSLLDPAGLRELTTPQVAMYPDLPGGYGMGLFVGRGLGLGDQFYDVPVWAHGGNTLTHTSTFFVLPAQRFAISILSNGVGDNFNASVVAAIESLVELPAAGVAPVAPFEPARLDALTGTYVDPLVFGDVIVTRDGDSLALSVPVLDDAAIPYQHRMSPHSTRVWTAEVDGDPVELTFIDGPDGEIYLRNRSLVAVRPAGGMLAPSSRPRPDRSALQQAVRVLSCSPVPSAALSLAGAR